MPLWTWVLTLVKGFLPIDGKRIGKIIWLAVWFLAFSFIYSKIVPPQNMTRVEKIETQIVNQCPKEGSLGFKLNLWKFYIKSGI